MYKEMAWFLAILHKQFLIVFLGFAGCVKLNYRKSRGEEFMWMEGLGKFWCLLSYQSMHPLPISTAWFSTKTNIHGLCQVHLTAFRQLPTFVHHRSGIGQRSLSLFTICKWHVFIHSNFSIFLPSPSNQAISW